MIRTSLLLISFLVFGVATPAAADELPRFSASSNAGPSGMFVQVSQITPCPTPPPDQNQYVEVTFTDAAGRATTSSPVLNEDGTNWDGSPSLYIPSKRITTIEPILAYSQESALGAGTLGVRCFTVGGGVRTTQEYQSQTFTVTGPTPRFLSSPYSLEAGATLHVTSFDPCPVPGSIVNGLISNDTAHFPFTGSVDPTTRAWAVDVVIPRTLTDPMSGVTRDLPLGKYRVASSCGSPGLSYTDEILDVVPPDKLHIAALGDSFSSGEGTFDYTNTGNDCHRSEKAYGPLLAAKSQPSTLTFRACSGAVTDDFLSSNPRNQNEPAQTVPSSLPSDTEVVVLTIGGNDAGFAEVIDQCVDRAFHVGWNCSDDVDVRHKLKNRLDALSGTKQATIDGRTIHPLADIYREIHRAAPRAKIYVGGYPALFGSDKKYYTKNKKAPGNATCEVFGALATVSYKDAKWIDKQAENLNEVIKGQIDVARESGADVNYADPALFAGHRICDELDPWFNRAVLDTNLKAQPESFHPTATGQSVAYLSAFDDAVRKNP